MSDFVSSRCLAWQENLFAFLRGRIASRGLEGSTPG